eukprot:symbB.v1.2.004605.t1/scaffold259.1/size252385/7
MPELKVITLRGDVLAVDVAEIQTVQQLKARFLEQLDPIEQKICRVEVFQGNSLLNDTQTLNEVDLDGESEVSVVYTSNVIEAASKDDGNVRDVRGFFGVIIPEDLMEVSNDAFRMCQTLVKVVIPDSKMYNKEIAFTGCTCIGDSAFKGCRSLAKINIPDSVTRIGDNAFAECKSLESINIPDSVTSIKCGAFKGCRSLEKINIPDSVTQIGDNAFAECESLKSISLPDSVTSINCGAFKGCRSLKSIEIPDSLTSIGGNGFKGCRSLEKIKIPDSVTQIEDNTFAECESLKSINIPDSVTSIKCGAFKGCRSLEKINIPDSVTQIGDNAFAECESLQTVKIPVSVTSIGDKAFADCQSLESMTVPHLDTSNFKACQVVAGCTSLKSISIPDSVTCIKCGAFKRFRYLEKINIPTSVTRIGGSAFAECESLKSIEIPFSVTSIEYGAFAGCRSLKNISIPDSVRRIWDNAFAQCESLQSVKIPDLVICIGSNAFADCQSLESIIIPDSVEYIGDKAFDGCSSVKFISGDMLQGTVVSIKVSHHPVEYWSLKIGIKEVVNAGRTNHIDVCALSEDRALVTFADETSNTLQARALQVLSNGTVVLGDAVEIHSNLAFVVNTSNFNASEAPENWTFLAAHRRLSINRVDSGKAIIAAAPVLTNAEVMLVTVDPSTLKSTLSAALTLRAPADDMTVVVLGPAAAMCIYRNDVTGLAIAQEVEIYETYNGKDHELMLASMSTFTDFRVEGLVATKLNATGILTAYRAMDGTGRGMTTLIGAPFNKDT